MPIDLSKLTSEQKDALIVQLLEKLNALTQQVQELQAQLKLNSRNSSKPPSSDGYGKPKPKSTRGKRSGGQPGHPGKTLKRTAHPDHIVDHAPEACTSCGLDLSAAPVLGFEARQVFDIPPIKIEATEDRAQIKTCPFCQSRNKAAFPEDVNQPVQYGTEVQCMVSYLSQYQMLPTHGSRKQWQICSRSISARGV